MSLRVKSKLDSQRVNRYRLDTVKNEATGLVKKKISNKTRVSSYETTSRRHTPSLFKLDLLFDIRIRILFIIL